jgi:DNA polymerase-1
VPRSDGGGIAYGRDALVESGDETLMAFAHYTEGRKILEVYIPYLRQGVDRPLTLKPNTILTSGRVSYDGAIMLLPREGGLRRCVRSRPGTVLSSTDYQGGELVTHAQSCTWMVGYSAMADALNAGQNLHNRLGAKLAGVSYEHFMAELKTNKFFQLCKQAAKPPNFGFSGGMGAVKLVLQQRKQGPDTAHESGPSWIKGKGGVLVPGYKGLRFCVLIGGESRCGAYKVTQWNNRDYPPTCRACIEVATELKKKWLRTWPENGPYLRLISQMTKNGHTNIVQHVSKRVRGKCGYSDAANGYFQGLLADAAKSALRRISKECYAVRSSPLYGSRVIVFQHDENILEHPEDVASEGAERVGVIMVEELQAYCPDLAPACVAKPALMYRWEKGAEELRGPDGRLIPWEPS